MNHRRQVAGVAYRSVIREYRLANLGVAGKQRIEFQNLPLGYSHKNTGPTDTGYNHKDIGPLLCGHFGEITSYKVGLVSL